MVKSTEPLIPLQMAVDVVEIALDFIAAYGLIAMFILLVLDGALLLPVFPGEIVLIMAVAAYAHDPAGLMMLIVLTTAAGLTGSLLLYGVTRGGGRRLVERYPKFFMMPRRRRERLERLFQRPAGQSLVLFLRLVPLTRILVNIPAGLARMPLLRFTILSTIGLAAYHAGFLWLTYEANRPGSTIATQKEQLQDAYASPAWEFMQTNSIITGAAVLAVGAVLSVRASIRMYRANPEEASGSLFGTVSVTVLFWGGIVLAVATYVDPQALFGMAALGGVDVQATAARLGLGPIEALLWLAAGSTTLGLLLARMRRSAKERYKRRVWSQRVLARVRERDEQRRAGPPTEPVDEATAAWELPPRATLFSLEHESTVESRTANIEAADEPEHEWHRLPDEAPHPDDVVQDPEDVVAWLRARDAAQPRGEPSPDDRDAPVRSELPDAPGEPDESPSRGEEDREEGPAARKGNAGDEGDDSPP